MSKLFVAIESISFWTFLLVVSMFFNFAGFSQINPEIVTAITSDKFNFFTFSGIDTGLRFLVGLSKFSVTNLHPIFLAFLSIMALSNFLIVVFFVRNSD